jgi:ubiquinone/menaquinone biosynthesis C-methylase UbiE
LTEKLKNRLWSEKIIRRFDTSFRHRWEIYNTMIVQSLNSKTIWIDCGCGNNTKINEYGSFAKYGIGVDIIDSPKISEHYIKADIKNLPFSSEYAELITLGFVVEHFDAVTPYFSEINRVLKVNGKIIILTTNLLSPFIFIPKILLPDYIKRKILTKLFKVQSDDIFPTHHKINTLNKFMNLSENLSLLDYEYISDLNYTRRWMFIIFLFWHIITGNKFMMKFRTNIMVILQKNK